MRDSPTIRSRRTRRVYQIRGRDVTAFLARTPFLMIASADSLFDVGAALCGPRHEQRQPARSASTI